jgi:hypothetical protein
MARELAAVDVTNDPELLRLAEEVRQSGKPRLLRRGGEDLAVLSPVGRVTRRTSRKAKTYTKADDDAFLASAGAWTDFDLEAFLKRNEESRALSRPPVEL